MNSQIAGGQERLYQDLARKLMEELTAGHYAVGSRLPAERELAAKYNVSRPTVREAVIALEVLGLVEVKVGSGAHVLRLPGKEDVPGLNISAFELTEARLLFESEVAALAATQASEEDLVEIATLVEAIARKSNSIVEAEQADRGFHLAIAKATRNGAMVDAIERLWDIRKTSPEAALLHEKARLAKIKPVVDEHTAILDALRARDPDAARAAMRNHLTQVIESLLFATEERQIEEARRASQEKRSRYSRPAT